MHRRQYTDYGKTKKHLYVLAICLFCCLNYTATAQELTTHHVKHLFDISGNTAQPLTLPTDIAVDEQYIYIVNSGEHNILIYDKRGEFIRRIGRRGNQPGELNNPVGIGLDAAHNIYVADKDNHRIQVFDGNGQYLFHFRVWVNNQNVRPIDVAVDSQNGDIYVTGNNNHRVMRYSAKGKLLEHWGGNGAQTGEFRYPATLLITPAREIAVVDVLNTRVQVFSKPQQYSISVGEWGVLPGQLFRPKGIAIDKHNNYYVSDSYMGVIQVFADTSHFLYVLGRNGEPHRFKTPTGIAVDDRNRLFVAEMLENRVSIFDLGR